LWRVALLEERVPKELVIVEFEELLLKVVLLGGGMARGPRGSAWSVSGVGEGGREEEERKKERKLWESPAESLSLALPPLMLLMAPCFPLGWEEWSSGERRAEEGMGRAEWVDPEDGRRSVWMRTGSEEEEEDGVFVSMGDIVRCLLVLVLFLLVLVDGVVR
jgi:hypothetical protein